MLFILCATEMKSWGRKKPCPKFPFKVKCEKTSSRVHSVIVARKSILQEQSPRPSAAAQSLPHPQRIIRKIQGESVPLQGNGISHCPSPWLSLTSMGTAVPFSE